MLTLQQIIGFLSSSKSVMCRIRKILLCLLFTTFCVSIDSQQTKTIALSGTVDGKPVMWDFRCSAGQNSGKWSKIKVPSCWEVQGFGKYTFGRYYLKKGAVASDEHGEYRRKFHVPSSWKDHQVEIVFEGVMTDAEVKVNGSIVGAKHQGAFYEFSYDITPLVRFGSSNLLEVTVWKQSSDKSVNEAERRADWWLFGGIYRPVWLKAVPRQHIRGVQISSLADGTLLMKLSTRNTTKGYGLRLTVAGKQQTVALQEGDEHNIETHWNGIKSWDTEHPHLYDLTLQLLNDEGLVVHERHERIGFRTIEFRENDGFYLNGTKLVIKGVNRHCFWPEGGRTVTQRQSLDDVMLIKQMNANAIRSHYSPDHHLLDICDSLGVLYLDEFCGWHGRYDTAIGEKLLREQMATDQNHPCVFLWANGNEGGWNTRLDHLFADLDLQQRHVIHPWQDFNGVDAHHYPGYYTGVGRLQNGYKVFMPTEFLHAQYDRGGGAGLEDYWQQWTAAPNFAGGFIWSFSDEAVMRTDYPDSLDTDGPNGPDGIVGPHREKEGSFFTIRDIWSPVQILPLRITSSFNGSLKMSNDFLFSRLSKCTSQYKILSNGAVIANGSVTVPDIAPGETGTAGFSLPSNFFDGDVLQIEVTDWNGCCINTWTWPIHSAGKYYSKNHSSPATSTHATVTDHCLSANGVKVEFDSQGLISYVESNGKVIPISGGSPVGLKATLLDFHTRMEGNDALFVSRYKGGIDSIVWRMTPDGRLSMEAVLVNRKGNYYDSKIECLGITFSYPEQAVKGMRWMGRGPYRVWKNRLRGQQFGIWQKNYNNTVTGEQTKNVGHLDYPEFKGYHANIYWAQLLNDNAPISIYSATDNLYLRLFTPDEPEHRRDGKATMPDFPDGDVSFLFDIPAIQSFRSISEQGPHSQLGSIRLNGGDEGLHLKLWFCFGEDM